jgi:RimJ/RimL family protein N-acetyltransferase
MYADMVSGPSKIRYEIDLVGSRFDVYKGSGHTISRDDLHPLAQLMLDAYRGTIDSEDESLEDAVDELASYFDGEPLLEHSFQVKAEDGVPISAVLVSQEQGDAFIGYVITDPDHKGRGLATEVVTRAVTSLQTAGFQRVVLYITEGNKPSERVFQGLGAQATT